MTTKDCADTLNAAIQLDGGFTARFIWGEIQDGRLKARVNHREHRRRARIRIHEDDFILYCETYYAGLLARVKDLIKSTAA